MEVQIRTLAWLCWNLKSDKFKVGRALLLYKSTISLQDLETLCVQLWQSPVSTDTVKWSLEEVDKEQREHKTIENQCLKQKKRFSGNQTRLSQNAHPLPPYFSPSIAIVWMWNAPRGSCSECCQRWRSVTCKRQRLAWSGTPLKVMTTNGSGLTLSWFLVLLQCEYPLHYNLLSMKWDSFYSHSHHDRLKLQSKVNLPSLKLFSARCCVHCNFKII